jgi:hypothetical protein
MLAFFNTLLDHLPEFLVMLALVGGCLYLLLRRHIYSLFDPLFFFLVVNEAFCITDVLFMHQYGMIESRYFTNYLLTEGALFLGFLQFRPTAHKEPPGPLSQAPPAALKLLYRLSLFLFISLNILVYTQRGIPLLLNSRMVVYTIGGGWGLVSRLFDVLIAIILYYLLEILRRRHWRLVEWGALVSVIIIQVLSGAKSAVVDLVFLVALYGGYTGSLGTSAARSGRMLKRLALGAVVSLLLVASVQSGVGEIAGHQVNLIGQVAARMVNGGDSLIYAYPNRFIEQLDGHNPAGAVFKEYLAFFRLSDAEHLPKHIGVQITDAFLGPDSHFQTNAKHNIFGYVYFGYWGALLFSYLIGTSLGIVRYSLPRLLPRNWVGGIPFIVLNLAFIMSCNDLDSGPRGVLNILVIFLPMALLARQLTSRSSHVTSS